MLTNYIKFSVFNLIITSFCLAVDVGSDNVSFDGNKTEALHQEISRYYKFTCTMSMYNNGAFRILPYITKDTHPILYELIEGLITKAHVKMPEYIVLYSEQYNMNFQKKCRGCGIFPEFNMATCICDDVLYICYETLSELSYAEVKGIIATAVAEKIVDRRSQADLVFAIGMISSLAVALKLQDNLSIYPLAVMALSLVSAIGVANNLQKKVDMNAACFTSRQEVIEGIKALCKIRETYAKEGMWSRLAKTLRLKEICNIVFYPIRASTPEERIYYLEKV